MRLPTCVVRIRSLEACGAVILARNCSSESGSTGLAVRKATLYSRSSRPAPRAAAPISPASPAEQPKPDSRLRGWLSRHRGALSFVAGVAVAGGLVLLHATGTPQPHALTQQDIDAA